MGVSTYMNKKGWIDAQGRQGKGFGVYRFLFISISLDKIFISITQSTSEVVYKVC